MKKVCILLLLFLVFLTAVFPALEMPALATGGTTGTLTSSARTLNTIIGACVGISMASSMLIVMGLISAAAIGWRIYIPALGLSSLQTVLIGAAFFVPTVVALALIFR